MPKKKAKSDAFPRPSTFSLAVLFCFFFSGLAGLIYQILWLRMIDKVVGSAPFAVATVLTVFMGGLALGSWLSGRTIDRIGSRGGLLSLYAKAEIAIGIYGLLLPLLILLAKPVYVLVYDQLFVHFWLYRIFTFLGCSVLLLVPTTLMGITLPVLCRFYVESLGHIGLRTGRLYGINTIGGAAGAVICGFFLIAALGVWGTLAVAVGINLLIGIVCIALAGRIRPSAPEAAEEGFCKAKKTAPQKEPEPVAVPVDDRAIIVLSLWIFAISGFCAMAYEVFWTRLLGLIIGPTTYSFSLVVATFIVGLALGNLLFGWLADRVKDTFRLLVITQACAACLALLVSQFLGSSQFFFSKLIYTFQGEFGAKIFAQSIVLFFVLVGPTIFLGATFPLVSRIYARSLPNIGRSIGTAYAVNTIGAILGSFIAGFIFMPLLGKENGLRVVAGLQLFSSLLAFTWLILKTGTRIRGIGSGVAGLALGLLLLITFPSWNHNILARGWYHRLDSLENHFKNTSWFEAMWKGASTLALQVADTDVVFYGDGIGGFTTVTKSPSITGRVHYTMLNSGKSDASSHGDRLTQALSAHIPLLFHPNAEKVMVVGLASGMTAGEALLYPVKQLDVLEINEQVVQAAEFFNPWNNECLKDPRTRILLQDGRNHLELTREAYDVVISEPSNPWMAGLANLFTMDYFETVKERLSGDGIFIQWFYSYQMDWPTFSMVGRTFASVFPDGLLIKTLTSDYLLIGFKGERNLDMETAARNMAYARKSTNITIRDPRILFNMIVTDDLEGFFGPGPFHTDNFPRLEYAAPKNLDRGDLNLNDEINKNRILSKETRAVVASNKDIDTSLDWLELMTADRFPPFDAVDLEAATPQQIGRYQGIVEEYCSEEVVMDYTIFPAGDTRMKCAGFQAARIRAVMDTGSERGASYYYLARACREMGDTDGQIDSLQKTIDLDPTSYGAYIELGLAFRSRGDTEKAFDSFSKALEINPDSADAHTDIGTLQAIQGNVPEAIQSFSRALAIDPDFVEAHNNIASALLYQGRVEAAAAHYLKALEISPEHVKTHLDYGRLLVQQGRPADAMNHFNEVLKADPDNADALVFAGLVLAQQGQMAEAVNRFEEALETDPDHYLAHKNLAITLLRQGKVAAAADHLERASEIKPDDSELHKMLGSVRANQGRLEAAADHFEKALQLEPDSAENCDNLGIALARMGRVEEAIPYFSKALEIDGSFESARNHLRMAQAEIDK